MCLSPLSNYEQNKEIPSMAVLALFIKTIDGIAYFAIGIFIFLHLCIIIKIGYATKFICLMQEKLLQRNGKPSSDTRLKGLKISAILREEFEVGGVSNEYY